MALEITADGYVVDTDSSLDFLIQSLPGFELINDEMKARALLQSLVPDPNGVWPGSEGYVTTYDAYYAALCLLPFLKAHPQLRQTSSEGTSIAMDPPDWDALGQYYRSMSKIVAASGNSALSIVAIPDVPHVTRTDMSGRGSDGNLDTDLE